MEAPGNGLLNVMSLLSCGKQMKFAVYFSFFFHFSKWKPFDFKKTLADLLTSHCKLNSCLAKGK